MRSLWRAFASMTSETPPPPPPPHYCNLLPVPRHRAYHQWHSQVMKLWKSWCDLLSKFQRFWLSGQHMHFCKMSTGHLELSQVLSFHADPLCTCLRSQAPKLSQTPLHCPPPTTNKGQWNLNSEIEVAGKLLITTNHLWHASEKL